MLITGGNFGLAVMIGFSCLPGNWPGRSGRRLVHRAPAGGTIAMRAAPHKQSQDEAQGP